MNLFERIDVHKLISLSGRKNTPRTLGALDLTLLGIGSIIGTGIFVLTGIVAATQTGPGIFLSLLIGIIVCSLIALCFAEFSSAVPVPGGSYSYISVSLGKYFAFISGWGSILAYILAPAAISGGWSAYSQGILKDMGVTLPSSLSSHNFAQGGKIDILAVFIVLLITFVLSLGAKESTMINKIIVYIKLAAIILFIAVGVGHVETANFTPVMPYGVDGIFAGASVLFFVYLGFDSVATTAEYAKNPQRNVPIGILASLAICAILYIGVSFVLTGMVSYKDLNVAHPVAYALTEAGMGTLASIISAAAVIGMTTVIFMMMFANSQIVYSMSVDRLIPKRFSSINPKNSTPTFNIWVNGLISAVIAGFVDLQYLASLINIVLLFTFLLVAIGLYVFRKTNPEIERPFKVPYAGFFVILTVVSCLFLMIQMSFSIWAGFIIYMLVGTLVYTFYSSKQSKEV
jgi:APA family basic amino acid/polyamine antiporter